MITLGRAPINVGMKEMSAPFIEVSASSHDPSGLWVRSHLQITGAAALAGPALRRPGGPARPDRNLAWPPGRGEDSGYRGPRRRPPPRRDPLRPREPAAGRRIRRGPGHAGSVDRS